MTTFGRRLAQANWSSAWLASIKDDYMPYPWWWRHLVVGWRGPPGALPGLPLSRRLHAFSLMTTFGSRLARAAWCSAWLAWYCWGFVRAGFSPQIPTLLPLMVRQNLLLLSRKENKNRAQSDVQNHLCTVTQNFTKFFAVKQNCFCKGHLA